MSLSYLLSWIYWIRPTTSLDATQTQGMMPVTVVVKDPEDDSSDEGEQYFWDPQTEPAFAEPEPRLLLPGSWSPPSRRISLRSPPAPPLGPRIASAPHRRISTRLSPSTVRATHSESATGQPATRSENRLSIILGHQSPIPERIREIFSGQEVSISHSIHFDWPADTNAIALRLIALNFGRVVMLREQEGIKGVALVGDLLRERLVKDVLSVRGATSNASSLGLDALHQLPYFDRFMQLSSTRQEEQAPQGLDAIICAIESSTSLIFVTLSYGSRTVSCLKVPTSRGDVYAIMHFGSIDSQIEGPRFIFTNAIATATQRLRTLLSITETPSSTSSSKLIGHIFTPRTAEEDVEDVNDLLFELSVTTFNLKKSLADATSRHGDLYAEKTKLEAQLAEMNKGHEANVSSYVTKLGGLTDENRRLAAEVESCNQARKVTVAALSERIDFLETENQRLRGEIETLRSLLGGAHVDAPTATANPAESFRPARVKMAPSKAGDRGGERDVAAENARLRAELKANMGKLNSLSAENSNLQTKAKIRSQKIRELTSTNQRLQQEVHKITALAQAATERKRMEDNKRSTIITMATATQDNTSGGHDGGHDTDGEQWVDTAPSASTSTLVVPHQLASEYHAPPVVVQAESETKHRINLGAVMRRRGNK
ncbi:hypothetical protein BDN72DRAFT_899268 [Pluteus cervinus]|uniref:Uncharacterized protein n=1 Tax=Pluteus cervinus TaxID=181527 RepID=A0ACD3ANP1_9AGAR|nr:hypothetical protein BDN72DRAFT_899268 [Pluteus cervinus]